MLPMIAVSGARSTMRRYNSMWDRAAAPSRWWHNPTLSFGPGYPQWVPSSSVPVDQPPIQANVAAARTVAAPRRTRGSCYKTGGDCKSGYKKVGEDHQGNAICCPSRAGPMYRNPGTLAQCLHLCGPSGTPGRAKCRQNCFHVHAPPKKGTFRPGTTVTARPGRPPRWPPTKEDACRVTCGHHGIGIEFHKCYQDCLGYTRSKPGDTRRRRRIRSSAKRRTQARAVARAARSMVTVGHSHHDDHEPEWKKAGSCCKSCHHGGPCEGGCGDDCNCGKEGRSANKPSRNPVDFSPTPTMRMRPALNASTVLIGDLAFSPPTTSRLLNRARARISRSRRGRRLVTRPGVPVPLGRPETLADCLYLCDKGDAKCRQDCFHKHKPR